MGYKRYYRADPRRITAKYAGRCGCGAAIKPGDSVMYFPRGKVVECEGCAGKTEALMADEDACERAYEACNGR